MAKFAYPEVVSILYGGTFDPFHRGHEALCNRILAQTKSATLQLIPCAVPALKAAAAAPAADRLIMLQLWASSHQQSERISVNDIEVRRNGLSHTADTIAALRRQAPGTDFIFALGADAWNSLPGWHRYQEFITDIGFWVFAREGKAAAKPISGSTMTTDFTNFMQEPAGKAYCDGKIAADISSSAIRNEQLKPQFSVPGTIASYIEERQLYRQ